MKCAMSVRRGYGGCAGTVFLLSNVYAFRANNRDKDNNRIPQIYSAISRKIFISVNVMLFLYLRNSVVFSPCLTRKSDDVPIKIEDVLT